MPYLVIHVKIPIPKNFLPQAARPPRFFAATPSHFPQSQRRHGFLRFGQKNLAETKRYKFCARRHKKFPATDPKRKAPCPLSKVAAWRRNGCFFWGGAGVRYLPSMKNLIKI